MQLARHFTKVYQRPRKPLAVSFADVFDAADAIIVQDVAFALFGTISDHDQTVAGRDPTAKPPNGEKHETTSS